MAHISQALNQKQWAKVSEAKPPKELPRHVIRRGAHSKDETKRKAARFSLEARRAKGSSRNFGGS